MTRTSLSRLAGLLGLTRPLIVFDLETTGLKPEEARIVEIAHEVHRPDGVVALWRALVRPGVALGTSTEIHHITEEMLASCRICGRGKDAHGAVPLETPSDPALACEAYVPNFRFADIAQNIARGYSNCDFAGKNIRYDLRVLACEMKRHNVEWSYAGAHILDADRLEALIEPRDLSSLYRRRLGKEPNGAHRADNDVRMTTEVLIDQIEKRGDAFPLDLKAIHDLSWPGWIDSEGKLRKGKDGIIRINFGKHTGVDIRNVPRDYWEWCAGLSRGTKPDFTPEFRQLALDMIAGKFPQ